MAYMHMDVKVDTRMLEQTLRDCEASLKASIDEALRQAMAHEQAPAGVATIAAAGLVLAGSTARKVTRRRLLTLGLGRGR